MSTTTTLHLKVPVPAAVGTLTAARLKVTTVLDAGELLAVSAPDGVSRVRLRIQLPERTVTADIAAKSLRKAQATVRALGADSVVLLLQGHLAAGEVIAEAGLSAQPKTAKPQPPAAGDIITGRS
jgi:hypothetical protein